MLTPLEPAIVRIYATDGAIVGAGFLATDRHVLTCAHMAADALDITRETNQGTVGNLKLDLPLIAPELTKSGGRFDMFRANTCSFGNTNSDWVLMFSAFLETSLDVVWCIRS